MFLCVRSQSKCWIRYFYFCICICLRIYERSRLHKCIVNIKRPSAYSRTVSLFFSAPIGLFLQLIGEKKMIFWPKKKCADSQLYKLWRGFLWGIFALIIFTVISLMWQIGFVHFNFIYAQSTLLWQYNKLKFFHFHSLCTLFRCNLAVHYLACNAVSELFRVGICITRCFDCLY